MKSKINVPEWENTSLQKKAQIDRITGIYVITLCLGALAIFYFFTK